MLAEKVGINGAIPPGKLEDLKFQYNYSKLFSVLGQFWTNLGDVLEALPEMGLYGGRILGL